MYSLSRRFGAVAITKRVYYALENEVPKPEAEECNGITGRFYYMFISSMSNNSKLAFYSLQYDVTNERSIYFRSSRLFLFHTNVDSFR